MKSYELKKISESEAISKLNDLRQELMKLRIQQKTKMAMKNTKQIRNIRRTIAQILTLQSNNQINKIKKVISE